LTGCDPFTAPSLRRRMACWLYEALLLFALGLIATLVFSVAIGMHSGIDPRRWLLQVFLVLVFGVYFSWFWSKGQTLPMKTWRIAVRDRHGRPLTQGRALIRYVYCAVWVVPPLAALASRQFSLWQLGTLFFGWVAFWALLSRLHPQGQFWHDAWAGTRLMDAQPPRSS
jgi:hypothetical protein